jgi:pimeloyl-ACP methyl ester carboxylesterase
VALLAAISSLAVMVGRDGTLGWQLLRVALVAAPAAGIVAASQRLRNQGRGWLAAAAGVVVLAVGIGFTPHLSKEPASSAAVAALVAVVAGLTLVVTGTLTRTRGGRHLRRAGAGMATLVAAVLAAFVIGPAVAATNVPPTEVGATPDQVGLVVEDVVVRTADGVDLSGWYVPSENGAALVVHHGSGSTRSNVLPEAAVLVRHGFGVLLVDARGHGGSGGRAMDFGWHGDADIAAGTAFLAARDDVDPARIGVLGSSMGGEEAIGASGSDDRIRAVVAEGATARTAADKEWLSEEHGVRGLLQEQIERLQYWLTDALTSASSPTPLRASVAGATGTRYLLITAGDVADEGDAAAHLAAAAPDRVETWEVSGAAHTDGLAVAPAEWEARVVAFLAEALDVPTDRV